MLDREESDAEQKVKIHQTRVTKTTRDIQMLYVSIMVGMLECVPLGCLQIIFILRTAKLGTSDMDAMGIMSLVTTWCMLGMKLAKVPELRQLWAYRKKQRRKCKVLKQGAGTSQPNVPQGTTGAIEMEPLGGSTKRGMLHCDASKGSIELLARQDSQGARGIRKSTSGHALLGSA